MVRDAYRDPIFNLKAVVERTGVTADALRAWERRYGLPDPARTEAGHRVYAQRDIDVIKWLVSRQEEGLRIGRAVKLWESLEAEGQDPLRSMPVSTATSAPRRPVGETVAEFRDAWVAACLVFDEQGAERVLAEALAIYPPDLVFTSIIGAGMAEIGHQWYIGNATPHQEHFASELAMRRLRSLIEATPPPTRRGRILTTCPPGEEHTLGMVTYVLLLRRAGWDVVPLGADVPLPALRPTIDIVAPDLIVAAAQRLQTAATLLDVAHLARELGIPLAYGGRIFNEEPSLRRRIPGHFLGATVDKAVQETEKLMTIAPRLPDAEPTSDAAKATRDYFLSMLPALEAHVCRFLGPGPLDPQTVRDLNAGVGGAIAAAVRFEDMELLENYLDWLEGHEEPNGSSADEIATYIRAFAEATRAELDTPGAPIVEWFSERVGGAS